MTSAKASFDQNIRRASYFLDIHEVVQGGRGAPLLPSRELPRGAIVFAIGAFDAYLSDVSAEVLLAQCRRGVMRGETREVMRQVARELPGLALEVALVDGEGERIERVRQAIIDHFQTTTSFFGADRLAATIQRMNGSPRDMWNQLRDEGFDDAAVSLEFWTDIRHRIVHRGETVRVRRSQGRSCIELLGALANASDRVAERAMAP